MDCNESHHHFLDAEHYGIIHFGKKLSRLTRQDRTETDSKNELANILYFLQKGGEHHNEQKSEESLF